MRIVFVVSSTESASPRYRAKHVAQALALSLSDIPEVRPDIQFVSTSTPFSVPIGKGDIIVLHRIGFAGAGGRFLHAARAVGAALVWSTDDLIFTRDFAHQIGLHFPDDPVRYRQHRAAAEDFQRMLFACDAVIVSTDYLAQQVTAAHSAFAVSLNDTVSAVPPVFVIRNFLSDAQLGQAKEAIQNAPELPSSLMAVGAEPVTLAYLSGSATHDMDLGTIATPLAAVLSGFPRSRLLLVGPVTLPPVLVPLADAGRILRHSFVPWQDLPALMTYCRVDINLAPLDISRPFIHAKSEVKFLEAAAVGIPTVASSAAGFAEGVREGIDCLLASDADDWERLLADMIQKPDLRHEIGRAAAAAVQLRGTAAANAETVQAVFKNLAQMATEGAIARADGPSIGRVQSTLQERLLQAGKKAEQGLMRLSVRVSRHLHRLREDVSGG